MLVKLYFHFLQMFIIPNIICLIKPKENQLIETISKYK